MCSFLIFSPVLRENSIPYSAKIRSGRITPWKRGANTRLFDKKSGHSELGGTHPCTDSARKVTRAGQDTLVGTDPQGSLGHDFAFYSRSTTQPSGNRAEHRRALGAKPAFRYPVAALGVRGTAPGSGSGPETASLRCKTPHTLERPDGYGCRSGR